MTQKRWVDVEDFATDSEREAIDGDEPEPEIGWRASLDVWPQLCSRTLVVQVIVCDTMDAYTMQLPFLAALRSELFAIGYTNALGYKAPCGRPMSALLGWHWQWRLLERAARGVVPMGEKGSRSARGGFNNGTCSTH